MPHSDLSLDKICVHCAVSYMPFRHDNLWANLPFPLEGAMFFVPLGLVSRASRGFKNVGEPSRGIENT